MSDSRAKRGIALFLSVALAAPWGASAAPSLQVDGTEVDAGDLFSDQRLEHVFTIENSGDEPLRIERVYGCGGPCRSYVLGTNVLAPGSRTTLAFSFDLYFVEGDEVRVRTIRSNDPAAPDVPLTFRCRVKQRYAVNPRLVLLRAEEPGVAVTSVVHIADRAPSGEPFTTATSSTGCFAAAVVPSEAPGGDADLIISMVPPMPEGFSRGEVVVRSNVTSDPPCRVRVSAFVRPLFSVIPERIVFDPVNEPQSRIVFVRQKTGGMVAVTGVDAPEGGGFSCEVNPGPEEGNLRIYVRASGLEGRRGTIGEIVIRTDDPAMPEIAVPVDAASVIIKQ